MKDNDTLFEINQDRRDVEYPLDLSFKVSDSLGEGKDLNYKFIKIGNINVNNHPVFIFDTTDSIGKMFYESLDFKNSKTEIKELDEFNYPYLPITRVFKIEKNNLVFHEQRDTIKFK